MSNLNGTPTHNGTITATANGTVDVNSKAGDLQVRHLEPRPFRPFKSSEEYLYAMKEDLAEWLNALYNLDITVDNFMEKLETGVILCRHANNIIRKARLNPIRDQSIPTEKELSYRSDVVPGTFHARDNVSQFISWSRKLGIMDCLLFETDDLVLRKNEKSFILCLLEIARRGSKVGMIAPMLVQLEQEIDREIAQDEISEKTVHTPCHEKSAITVNSTDNKENQKEVQNMKNLHEMVVDILNRCSCPSKFPMIKVADGKYRIGDTKVLIFVRILRAHVMVRVGGGWDTLGHYLDRHDPCRCRAGHRFSTSAKLTFTEGDPSSGPQMVVTYNRPEEPANSLALGGNGVTSTTAGPNGIRNLNPPASNLKRRNSSGPATGEYSSLMMPSHSSSSSTCSASSSLSFVNANSIGARNKFNRSRKDTSSPLTLGSEKTASQVYSEVTLDRQESRTSHYSDDSTDTSSVIMESPSPTHPDSHCEQSATESTVKTLQATKKPTRGSYHDSSSSEFSESEINHNSANSSIGGNVITRMRKCSPRKIMKTSDLLGTDKPSWASDDFTVDEKDNDVNNFKLPQISPKRVTKSQSGHKLDTNGGSTSRLSNMADSSSPFQRNSRYRRSEQKMTSQFADNSSKTDSENKSRSSEDLSNAGAKKTWKNPLNCRARPYGQSVSVSPSRKLTSQNKRAASSERKDSGSPSSIVTGMSCFERGRNYYASLPRSRSSSQSSRSPLTENGVNGTGQSNFVRGSPGRYSLRGPRGSLPESISLGSCRADRYGSISGASNGIRTPLSRQNSENESLRSWTFKSRTRPALDPDLFKQSTGDSRSSIQKPGQRSRSSDSSPSRTSLTNRLINSKVNGHQTNNNKKIVNGSNNQHQPITGSTNESTDGDVEDDHDVDIYSQENDILKKMENLVNQYQSRIERAMPCKIVNSSESLNSEVDCDGKVNESAVINCSTPINKFNSSKIPMPIRSASKKDP